MKKQCFNCEHRTAECHISCESYKAYREHCDKIIDKRTKENESDPGVSKARLRKLWKEMKR